MGSKKIANDSAVVFALDVTKGAPARKPTPPKLASTIATTYQRRFCTERKTASAGSIFRIPAADIEDVVVKFLKRHRAVRSEGRAVIRRRGDVTAIDKRHLKGPVSDGIGHDAD